MAANVRNDAMITLGWKPATHTLLCKLRGKGEREGPKQKSTLYGMGATAHRAKAPAFLTDDSFQVTHATLVPSLPHPLPSERSGKQ